MFNEIIDACDQVIRVIDREYSVKQQKGFEISRIIKAVMSVRESASHGRYHEPINWFVVMRPFFDTYGMGSVSFSDAILKLEKLTKNRGV